MMILRHAATVRIDGEELEVRVDAWESYNMSDGRTRDLRPTATSRARAYEAAATDLTRLIAVIQRRRMTLLRRARREGSR